MQKWYMIIIYKSYILLQRCPCTHGSMYSTIHFGNIHGKMVNTDRKPFPGNKKSGVSIVAIHNEIVLIRQFIDTKCVFTLSTTTILLVVFN